MVFSAVLFFLNDTAPTEISPLSLHDALPISSVYASCWRARSSEIRRTSSWRHANATCQYPWASDTSRSRARRSEEHTSELQSQSNLVCRLLLEKKKKTVEPRDPASGSNPLMT